MAKALFDYEARGMTFYYSGKDYKVFFIEDSASDLTIVGQAQAAAKNQVYRLGHFPPQIVTILNVRVVE